jgi:regulator of protease activity HflC (stomatin/prohibitin superfamily)
LEAFAWIGDIIQALGKFIPRLILIRATHRGIRWRRGHSVHAMDPGLHIYWPVITDVEQIVVARQTLNLPTQVLMTKDRHQIVVGCLIVYRIKDVILAVGERNFDVDSTVSDVTQAAIVEVCSGRTLSQLQDGIASDVEAALTKTTRKRLRQFGVFVQRCAVTDFSTCRTYKLITNEPTVNHPIAI